MPTNIQAKLLRVLESGEIRRLVDRQDDISLLAQHFLNKHNTNMAEKKFCPDTLEYMKRYSWPGNIRELENFVENIIIVVDGEKTGVRDLPGELRGCTVNDHVLDANVTLSDLEKQHIINTLSKMNGKKHGLLILLVYR